MKQLTFLYEPDIVKAGTCCLKMVVKFHDDLVSLAKLSANNYKETSGLSLFDIVQAAESMGFETLAAKVTFEVLKSEAYMPCIIHWQAKHFVVVYKINRSHVFVADPKLGKRKYLYADFIKSWYTPGDHSDAGIVLILEPTSDFFYRVNNDKARKKDENRERRKLRRRIVNLLPSPPCCKESIKAHVLLGKSQIGMTICTCKAMNLAIGVPVSYVFHDDGSLTRNNSDQLLFQFPGSVVIERSTADKIASDKLKDHPACKFVRENNVLMLKLFDIFFWSGDDERVAYIDSDIIFFKNPEQYINELNNAHGNNFFNQDVEHGCFYTLTIKEIESIMGTTAIPRINSGLWVLNRSFLNIDLIEKWLSVELFRPKLLDGFLEQTLMAMLASISPQKSIYFNKQYDLGSDNDIQDLVCKHYVAPIRKDYELEGLNFLLKEQDFVKKWRRFAKEFDTPN